MNGVLEKRSAIHKESDRLAWMGIVPKPEANSTAAMPILVHWPRQAGGAASTIATELEKTPVAGLDFLFIEDDIIIAIPEGKFIVFETKSGLDQELGRARQHFLDTIDAQITQDVEDAREGESPEPTQIAVRRCKEVARRISSVLLTASRLKYAATAQAGGGMCLVIQSLEAHRRVEFSVAPDGAAITLTKVDEHMRVTHELHTDNKTLVEPASWVVGNR